MEKRNDHALDVLREEMHQQKIVAVRTAAKAARASAEEARPQGHAPHRQEADADRREREKSQEAITATASAQGYSSGHAEGEEEGYTDGYDEAEPTQCSNDPDVPLPYC